MNTSEIIVTVIIAILTIGCGILGIMLQRKTERIKIVETQFSERKTNAYADLAGLLYEMLNDIKQNKPVITREAQKTERT